MPPTVDHVVVIALENRSFDHMLGFAPHPDPAFDGLLSGGPHTNPPWRGGGPPIPATADAKPVLPVDPDHSHDAVMQQLRLEGLGSARRPTMQGFVASYEEKGRVLATLALQFGVCSRWFASVPGETWPNRNLMHAATSDGTVDNQVGFYQDRTIFEQLEANQRTWRIYYDDTPQIGRSGSCGGPSGWPTGSRSRTSPGTSSRASCRTTASSSRTTGRRCTCPGRPAADPSTATTNILATT